MARLNRLQTLSLLLTISLVLNLYLAYKWEFAREILAVNNYTVDLVSGSHKIKPGMSKEEVLSLIRHTPTNIRHEGTETFYEWMPDRDPPPLYRLRFGTGGNGSYFLIIVFDENDKVLRVTADSF